MCIDQPVILQSSRNVGVSAPKPLRTGSELLLGTGMVMVMGLWNFLLRGSRVTMGLKVALLPRIFLTTSTLTDWAYESREPATFRSSYQSCCRHSRLQQTLWISQKKKVSCHHQLHTENFNNGSGQNMSLQQTNRSYQDGWKSSDHVAIRSFIPHGKPTFPGIKFQPNPDPLGECALRKNSLYLGNNSTA